jgi:hypothetical protein
MEIPLNREKKIVQTIEIVRFRQYLLTYFRRRRKIAIEV